ncbi:hypothetical protein DINM_001315 [Dirofilaria immitis]|nr:hypothetical protein [Dirofilaria immitis]
MSFTGAVHLSKCNAVRIQTAKAWPIDPFELIRRFLARGVRKVTTGITNYDLITGQDVVSSRAASILRSVETYPLIGRFVAALTESLTACIAVEWFLVCMYSIMFFGLVILQNSLLRASHLNNSGEINTVECDEAGECSNRDINSDESNLNGLYLEDMAYAGPIRDSVGKYLAALPSSDLLTVRISSKSLCVFATEVLLKRIKPLFIKDGNNITNPIDRWIFPTYETSEDIYRDFFVVSKWQSQFLLNKSNDLESTKYKSANVACFHVSYTGPIPEISQINFDNNISKCIFKDAILFPNAYTSNIVAVEGAIVSMKLQKAKLVFIFSNVSWSRMESVISDILSIRENRSLSVIYVKSYFPHMPSYSCPFSSIIFHDSNVEASTFLVKTNDEKELRKELLEWKEIFNTEPFSMPFHKDYSKDVGLVHLSSTTSSLNDGSMFAIIGFKKYLPYTVEN